jgi:hypothetical protein
MSRRFTIVGVVCLVAVAFPALVFALERDSTRDVPSRSGAARSGESILPGTPDAPYPPEWEVEGLDEAREAVEFSLLDPPASLTHSQEINHVYVFPDDVAVAIDFPPQPQGEAFTRQSYIEIYEAGWSGGDPKAEFAKTVASTAHDDDSTFELNGVPALGVQPNSPADVDQANPAYVEFMVDGVDIQVSGGTDFDALLAIAESMIDSAPSTT